jgi:plastocyanin
MSHHPAWLRAAMMVAVLTLAGCGGDSDATPGPSPSPSPSPTPTPTPTPTPGGTTFTITASGVSPRTLTVPAGSRVTFVNNDTRVHDMASNPHPEHTDCPPLNQVGFLQPGQTGTSGNLTTVRTCGFHDHNRDTDTSLQGTIVIQ